MITCLYCNIRLSGMRKKPKHEKRCFSNPNRVVRTSWNKGKKTGFAWNRGLKGSTTGKASSPELEALRCEKISKAAKLRASKGEFGGYIKGSGRGKKGWYKGISVIVVGN